ncbi:MAG: ATP-binding protein [Paludibacter sp.]|nr:ATP-binding protein [Paludibacter sp.]
MKTINDQVSLYSRSIMEASSNSLVTIDTKGKIMDLNESVLVFMGLSRERLIGSNFPDYFSQPNKAREFYQDLLLTGSAPKSRLIVRHNTNEQTELLFAGSVYKDELGIIQGAVVSARSIPDDTKNRSELNEAIQFAELATRIAEDAQAKAENTTQIAVNAVKTKQQFLSNMSHEIRTPMNSIIGFTKVLLKTDLSGKQKEYLTAIKMSGDALIILINDILDLAKVDAGKMTFEQTPFNIDLSVTAILHLLDTKIQEKNLELNLEFDSRIPKVVLGDPIRLHQIILNLMSNAVKFTSKGKISVSVNMLNENDENVELEFTITDTGIGISQDKISNVFDHFEQATNNTSRLYGGTGLGLAIVKHLVELQGGTVSVKSKIDEGSVFSFRLNYLKTNTEIKIENETEPAKLNPEDKNIKVLVVEDIPLNQLLIRTILDEFGFEQDISGNGKIAIEKLKVNHYDIILMDLQMPEMNGFETTEYIRNILKLNIPIIALTADVTTVDLEKCRYVGMNDYISKPVDEKLLYTKIVGLVRKPISKSITELKHSNIRRKKVLNKYIDLDNLILRTKSNPKLILEMIALYLEQTPILITLMKQSFHDKDWMPLYSAVHKMIPSFSIMGIHTDFEKIAKRVQEYANTQKETEGMPDLVYQLENVCSKACEELEVEFNTIKNSCA